MMVDGNALAEVAQEMVLEMRGDSCQGTVTQAAQVLDLGNGRKATVCITITTDQERFL
jgi:hypothetical protein